MNFLGKDILYEISLYCGYKKLKNLFFAFPEIKTIIPRLTKLHIERLLINQTLSIVDNNYNCHNFFQNIISSKGTFQKTKSFDLRKFYSLLIKKSVVVHSYTVRVVNYYHFNNSSYNPYIVSEIYANEVIRRIEEKKLNPAPQELMIILYSYPRLIDKIKSIVSESCIRLIYELSLFDHLGLFGDLRAMLSK